MTTTQTIEKRVIEIIVENATVDRGTIRLESVFYEDIPMDSLDLVEIVMTLEEEFEVELSEDDIGSRPCVGDVVDLIRSRLERES